MTEERDVADERATTTGDARSTEGRAAAPVPDVRRALVLLVASFVALVGIVAVAGVYVGLVGSTVRQTSDGTVPCLVAFSAGTDHAHVSYQLVPPRAVCRYTPSADVVAEKVLAEGSTVLFGAGVALAAAGVVTIAVVLARSRRRKAR